MVRYTAILPATTKVVQLCDVRSSIDALHTSIHIYKLRGLVWLAILHGKGDARNCHHCEWARAPGVKLPS